MVQWPSTPPFDHLGGGRLAKEWFQPPHLAGLGVAEPSPMVIMEVIRPPANDQVELAN